MSYTIFNALSLKAIKLVIWKEHILLYRTQWTASKLKIINIKQGIYFVSESFRRESWRTLE